MRFDVTINDKVWKKIVSRLQTQGVTAETDAELFEGLLATTIAEGNSSRNTNGTSDPFMSTDIILTLGRVVVKEVA